MIGLGKCAVAVVVALLIGYTIGLEVTRGDVAAAAGLLDGAKVMHVGVVVKDIEKTSKMYATLLGIAPPKIGAAPPGFVWSKGFNADPKGTLKYVQIPFGNTMIELAEPVGGASPWRNFLDTHGEGIHHVAFGVPDRDGTAQLLQSNGGKMEFSTPTGPVYVNSEGQTGFTFELFKTDNK